MQPCDKCGFNVLILFPITKSDSWVCWECYNIYLKEKEATDERY